MAELYNNVQVVERTEVKPSGKVEKVYRISAYTKRDSFFTIIVKEKDFNKDKIAELLTERATEIESIESL